MPAREPRFNLPKLEMSPPNMCPWTLDSNLSPLHMSPPAMALPNFSPPHFKLPTLSASKYFPPGSLWDEYLTHPPSVITLSTLDPTILVVGTYPNEESTDTSGSIQFYRLRDHTGEVRGDRDFPPDEPRKKIVPRMSPLAAWRTDSAVMDACFSPADPEVLVVVTALGSIYFFRCPRDPVEADDLVLLGVEKPLPQGSSVLTVGHSVVDPRVFAVGLETGHVIICKYSIEPASDGGSDDDDDDEEEVVCEATTTIPAHAGGVRALRFSGNKQRLYTGGEDGVVRAWSLSTKGLRPSCSWEDTDSHNGEAVTSLCVWPFFAGGDVGRKRKLLLTGCVDGKFRAFDLSSSARPPTCVQELEVSKKPIWRLEPLPGLPDIPGMEAEEPGVFSPLDKRGRRKEIKFDHAHAGVIASSLDGQSRVILQRQKFSSIFILKRDNESGQVIPDEENMTKDGVEKDWYDREKEYEFYNVCEFREHSESVMAGGGAAMIEWDSVYKVGGKQQKRRGWRLVSGSVEDQKICVWQVYVD